MACALSMKISSFKSDEMFGKRRKVLPAETKLYENQNRQKVLTKENLNPLSANPIKLSNTQTICRQQPINFLSV